MNDEKPMGQVIQIDEARIRDHLGEMHAGPGRGVRHWQVACFWTGWTLLALALLSPLHWLGEHLFVAHMVEHEVLMVVAAPLLAVARPIGAFLWALPLARP